MNDHEHDKAAFFYFVGETKYSTELSEITGAQVKARIADLPAGTSLSLEGHGNEPDRMIGDGDSVSLVLGHGEGARHFILVPPATFG
jgi:hypothetical protein